MRTGKIAQEIAGQPNSCAFLQFSASRSRAGDRVSSKQRKNWQTILMRCLSSNPLRIYCTLWSTTGCLKASRKGSSEYFLTDAASRRSIWVIELPASLATCGLANCGNSLISLRSEAALLTAPASMSEMASITNQYLRAKLSQQLPDRRVARAIHLFQHQTCRLDSVASHLGLSARQLQRLFQAHVGLEPKIFARIARFQRALHAGRTTGFNWTRIAQDCGYYDQAHLIADFKEFSGAAPAARPVSPMGDCLSAR